MLFEFILLLCSDVWSNFSTLLKTWTTKTTSSSQVWTDINSSHQRVPRSVEEGSTAECPGEEGGALKTAQEHMSRSTGGGSTAECPGAWEKHYRMRRSTGRESITEHTGGGREQLTT